MASSCSSTEKRNFQCVTVASVDLIKLPLRNILDSHVKPVDLYYKIQSCSTLKLRPDQLKICLIPPPGVPDYNTFDVTLLYTLIRNLCSLPCPAQGWGNEPKTTDTQISDDIERLRLFRNNYYAHAESAVISNAKFEDVWKNLKLIFKRIQPKTACSIDYEEQLIHIERTQFTDDYLTTFRVLLEALVTLEKQTDNRDEPTVSIRGENEIMGGDTAYFEADVKKADSSCWSITWHRRRDDIKCIDTTVEKYSGSTKRTLVINDVCKEDEGEYQALLSFESKGPDYKSRNTIRLHVIGDVPSVRIFVDSPVCFGSETIIKSVVSSTPAPEKTEWQKSKDGTDFHLIRQSYNYLESTEHFKNPFLVIPKTTFADKLFYRLWVWNRVGKSASNKLYLDVTGSPPNITTSFVTNRNNKSVKLMGEVYFLENSPGILKTFWTKNGEKIDIKESGGKLSEMINDNPSLMITNVGADDAGEYRVTAVNAVGSTTSEVIVLGIPSVFSERVEDEKNGGRRITVTITSFPTPCQIQWNAKSKDDDTFTPIDINADEYIGTTVTFPHPMLVVRQRDQLENNCYQIEVTNFVGKIVQTISGENKPNERRKDIVQNRFYKDRGASVRFTKLSNVLAKEFPPQKLENLKFTLTNSNIVQNRTSVMQATSALECIRILQDEQLYTQTDVIFMQFLCTQTECLDLHAKCVEYAEQQKALCYFEKPPVNGYKNAQFHVKGELSNYTKDYIQDVIETVAAILDCKVEDILLNGVKHSKSFLLFLALKEVYMKKLLAMNKQDCLRLLRLKIDYLIIDKETIHLERPKGETYDDNPVVLKNTDSFLIDGHIDSFEDVERCSHCKAPIPIYHCDVCDVNMCRVCVSEHDSNDSKEHKVVALKTLERIAKFDTKCTKHFVTYCNLYCEQCDISVCDECVSSKKHIGHEISKMRKPEGLIYILQKDLEKLELFIYPNYKEILSRIKYSKDDINTKPLEWTTRINKHNKDLQRGHSDLDEIKSKHLEVLNHLEDEVVHIFSEITLTIAELKTMLNSYDASLVFSYKSRNVFFQKMYQKFTSSFSLITFKINQEHNDQQVGSYSELSLKTVEPDNRLYYSGAGSFFPDKPNINTPRLVTDINTKFTGLYSVSCLRDEKIWTCGFEENIISLYNHQGELLNSIQIKSECRIGDIAVKKSGNLVYTDICDKSVNIATVWNIKTVIRLRRWTPLNVCCTCSDDLLIVIVGDNNKRTKVVRYSGSTAQQSIQYNDKGQYLYSSDGYPKYISENRNLDICVSDYNAHAVVVVNKAGKLRFTYTGTPTNTKGLFSPRGITTDSQSQILTIDSHTNFIHILDQNGQFIRVVYLDLCNPSGLCVDSSDNLFVAEYKGKLKRIQLKMQKTKNVAYLSKTRN